MLYDISPTLSPQTPVWPGDTLYSVTPHWTLDAQCPVNVGRITLSGHTGAHTDAASHYGSGVDMACTDLAPYIGPCRVVHCIGAIPTIVWDQIQAQLHNNPIPCPPRVLFRTYLNNPTQQWDPHFCALDPALILGLSRFGVKLIGIDTPSIDPMHSKTLDAHHVAHSTQMAILEGINLDNIAAGDYELIALPLKLQGADASPVRAVLRTL